MNDYDDHLAHDAYGSPPIIVGMVVQHTQLQWVVKNERRRLERQSMFLDVHCSF